jgi:hypothetical protein
MSRMTYMTSWKSHRLTKQATIFIKNHNCFIYRLILAIVCTIVKVHQSNIPPSWVGVTLKTQQISELGGLVPPT